MPRKFTLALIRQRLFLIIWTHEMNKINITAATGLALLALISTASAQSKQSVGDEVARAIAQAFAQEKVSDCRTAKLKLNPGTPIRGADVSVAIRKAKAGARPRLVKSTNTSRTYKYLFKNELKRLCLSFEGRGHQSAAVMKNTVRDREAAAEIVKANLARLKT